LRIAITFDSLVVKLVLDRSQAPISQSPHLAHMLAVAATVDLIPQKLANFGRRHVKALRGFLDRETRGKGI
jgi:hypothetical protein